MMVRRDNMHLTESLRRLSVKAKTRHLPFGSPNLFVFVAPLAGADWRECPTKLTGYLGNRDEVAATGKGRTFRGTRDLGDVGQA
jgi:hypothetical protein